MSDKKALELLHSADKMAQSRGWFSGPKYDEAADLYEQAANQFRLARQMREAGEAMLKAAQMSLKLGESNDAAQHLVSASKCFKKGHPKQAVDALTQAVGLLTERGAFRMAAAHQKDIAKLCELDLSDPEQAMQAYQLAAEWYAGEDATALANGCLLQVASLAAQLEDYARATQIFESIAEGGVDDQLTKWSVKDYFLKAALCRLAIPDDVGAAQALERYKDLDPAFASTRECRFVEGLVADIRKSDMQAFTDHVASYDQISQLDNWKTTLLLRIKRQILEAGEDLT
ncbi:vesicular-fusion protein S17 [Coemansia biformis]|uniref:Vesicular-fusion protein S17 n=1 Tax=Coemansia biformis TaxID=1286918 RepID=A0A9W7Y7I1_9FUNG|nr:vesicular-fusion protein S17 [Coemansia biformis]